MKKLTQTRLHNPPEVMGNCFPTVIACFMDLDSPEDVIQIQENFTEEGWNNKLYNWLVDKGWLWGLIKGHLYNDKFYLVSGKSPRFPDEYHVCIYQNGKLYHDPHPDGTGILTEEMFEILVEI